jgi:hypothetical protein
LFQLSTFSLPGVTLSASLPRSSRPIRVEPTPRLDWLMVERPIRPASNPSMSLFREEVSFLRDEAEIASGRSAR